MAMPSEVQKKKNIAYIEKGVRGAHTKLKMPAEPEPEYSRAATLVMDEIAPIIDTNQRMHELLTEIILRIQTSGIIDEAPLDKPRKETGLMMNISLIQQDTANIHNHLLTTLNQHLLILEKHNESSEKGNTK